MFDFFKKSPKKQAGVTIDGDFGWLLLSAFGGTWGSPLKIPEIAACVGAIAKPLAALPVKVQKEEGINVFTDQKNLPIYQLLNETPNPTDTAVEYRSKLFFDLLLQGNAVSVVKRRNGDPTELHHIPFASIDWSNYPRLMYTSEDQLQISIEPGEYWHLKNFSQTNGIGDAPLDLAKEALRTRLGLGEHVRRYFEKAGSTGGVLEWDGHFQDDDSRRNFMRAWHASRTGDNVHRDAVLEYGMKYQPGAMNNEEGQVVELKTQIALDFCRVWDVPPHRIGILEKATFNNLGQENLRFIQHTLHPWAVLFAQSAKQALLAVDGTREARSDFRVVFDFGELEKVDPETMNEADAKGRQWGWLSANEIRAKRGLNPIGREGDRYLEPENMRLAGADAREL